MGSALNSALQAQEAYRTEYYSTQEQLDASRAEVTNKKEELKAIQAEYQLIEQTKAELVQVQNSLTFSQNDIAAARVELETSRQQHQDSVEAHRRELNEAQNAHRKEIADYQKEIQKRDNELSQSRAEVELYSRKTLEIQAEFGKA